MRKTIEKSNEPQSLPKTTSNTVVDEKTESFLNNKISLLEEDVKNKEKEIKEMKIKMINYDKERDEYIDKVKGKENEINILKLKIMSIEREIKNRDDRINDLHKEMDNISNIKKEIYSSSDSKKV